MISDNTFQAHALSIIIVNFNSGDLLGNCLNTIFRFIHVDFEVVIYDNASSDDSISSLHPDNRIKIIPGKENLGFAKANNLAAHQASGKFLHFLNPDIEVNETLDEAYKQIISSEDQSIWVTGLTDEHGALQKNKHIVPRVGNLLRRLTGNPDIAYWNIGASIIIHRDAFKLMGGWPDEYFMYAEDLDFFYTAHKNKIPVNYLGASLMHIGKGVTHKIWNDEQRATVVEKSFRTFYRKYHAGWEYLVLRPIQLSYMLFNEPGKFPLYTKVFFKTLLKK